MVEEEALLLQLQQVVALLVPVVQLAVEEEVVLLVQLVVEEEVALLAT